MASLNPPALAGNAILNASPIEWLSRLALAGVGAFGGIFIVPLQVCLQTAPPESQKGRMIATMNFANWVGILLSALFYFLVDTLRRGLGDAMDIALPPGVMFGALAVVLIPVAVLYRPADRDLN